MNVIDIRLAGMDEGADFVLRTLAKALGVDDWEQADGSEEWEGDVAGTLYNILAAGRVYDPEDGRVARLDMLEVLRRVAAAPMAVVWLTRVHMDEAATGVNCGGQVVNSSPTVMEALTAIVEGAQ